MMSRWSWLALGAGAYLAFTLAAFPASTAVRWFAPPNVAVVGAEGTLWSGGAASCSVAGLSLEALRWRVRPWWLLIGRLDATVEARIPDGFVSADVVASTGRVALTNLRGGTSLTALTNLLPVRSVRGMRGQGSVALQSLVLEDGWPVSIVGELRVAGLEVPPFVPTGTSGLLPLGDYTITFAEAPPGRLAARFVDTAGPLAVDGSVALDETRTYTLDAFIKPRADASDTLVQGLQIMTAEPDAEGRRRLTLTGSL